jgi:hypothetical protein
VVTGYKADGHALFITTPRKSDRLLVGQEGFYGDGGEVPAA